MQTIKFTDSPTAEQAAYLSTLPMSEVFQLLQNRQRLEEPMSLFDQCLAMAATNLNRGLSTFWQLPDAELLALLDFYGPAGVQEIFAAHELRAAQINEMREQRGLSPLAVIGALKQITVNPETGKFEIVPPPVEEPETEPENPPL